MYEVEVKFPVADMPALERKLVALAGRFRETVEQVDRYFAHPARDFARTDEALRLRRVHEVTKRRLSARVLWQGAEVDVALDSVANIGDFVELEIPARQGEVPLAQACVMSLAKELNCGTPEKRSYLEMVLAARKP